MKSVLSIITTLLWFSDVRAIEVATELPESVAAILNDTRRILNGWEVTEGRPYMVHLKLPRSNLKQHDYRSWLCGGVIVHEEYIVTSAACIEDAEHFYIVSGTYKYAIEDDKFTNLCIKNGAKKAIWKCVPKNYVFDGHENDNIRWLNNDIAVVKVEDGFDFERRVKGCDFIPKPIPYNNQSLTLENAGNIVWVAGWGSTLKYSDHQVQMNNNIAVLKWRIAATSDRKYAFTGCDIERRVKCCNFIPKPIPYNNQSATLENAGNTVWVTEQGSTLKHNVTRRNHLCDCYLGRVVTRPSLGGPRNAIVQTAGSNTSVRAQGCREWLTRRKEGGQALLESRVEIIPKNRCKRRWGTRYNNIIDNYMICTKDIGQTMSEICNEKYVDCQDINYSEEEEGRRADVIEKVPTNLVLHSAYDDRNDNHTVQRRAKGTPVADGGFCENDHGGPLIYGEGTNAVVIGVISACLVKERTNKCYGPFLYTSIFKNRQFISCAIFKDIEPKCRRQFRSGETHTEKTISWKNHEDGPATNELDHPLNNDWKYEPKSPQPPKEPAATDKVFANRGYVLKAEEQRLNSTDD